MIDMTDCGFKVGSVCKKKRNKNIAPLVVWTFSVSYNLRIVVAGKAVAMSLLKQQDAVILCLLFYKKKHNAPLDIPYCGVNYFSMYLGTLIKALCLLIISMRKPV